MILRALIGVEIRRFFSQPWNLRLAALALPAIWLALWQYSPSPFVPIFAAVFIGLEPQYCNIFFHAPNEIEALSVTPVPWKVIILAKNLATILITLICLPILSVIVIYFSPDSVSARECWIAFVYLLSVIFPLLHLGNLQSLQHPRRHTGWRIDDLAGGILMAAFAAIVSLPFVLLVGAGDSPLLCLLYSAVAGYFLFRHDARGMARRVSQSKSMLCTVR